MSTLQKSMRSTLNVSGLTHVYKKGNLRLIFLFWPEQRSLKLWISKYLEKSIDWRNAYRQEAISLLPLFPSVSYQIHICFLIIVTSVFAPQVIQPHLSLIKYNRYVEKRDRLSFFSKSKVKHRRLLFSFLNIFSFVFRHSRANSAPLLWLSDSCNSEALSSGDKGLLNFALHWSQCVQVSFCGI